MKKKIIKICTVLLCASLLLGDFTERLVWATSNAQTGDNSQTSNTDGEQTEDPVLNLPITTDQITGWPKGPKIKEETAVLMEAETGTVLYDKQMGEKRYPASTTKIMTALLALENSKMDEIVTFTETGMEAAYGGSSNIIPVLGEQFTMEQCIYMILLKSANDVSNQVAEHVGGSVENFLKMMNDRAKELGCKNTHFNNPSGLPDEEHYTTAYDLALIMKEALKNEGFKKIISTTKVVIPATNKTNGARTYENHHHMILDGDYHYDGTIGGKTGYTDAARSTLVTAVQREETTLIAVVLKVIGRQCFTDTISLMDYGFDQFKKVDLSQDTKDKVGKVMLPKTASLEELQVTDLEKEMHGNTKQYTYNGQLVGVGISQEEILANQQREGEEEKHLTSLIEQRKAQDELEKKQEESNKKQEQVARTVTKVLVIVVIVGSLLAVVVAIRRNLERKRRRRKKRRMREYKAKLARQKRALELEEETKS